MQCAQNTHPGNPRVDWEYVGMQLVPADSMEPAEWLELRNCPNCHTTRAFRVPDDIGRMLCPKQEEHDTFQGDEENDDEGRDWCDACGLDIDEMTVEERALHGIEGEYVVRPCVGTTGNRGPMAILGANLALIGAAATASPSFRRAWANGRLRQGQLAHLWARIWAHK